MIMLLRLSLRLAAVAALSSVSACATEETGAARDGSALETEVAFDAPLREPYRLASGFGPRLNPRTQLWAMHTGVDLAAPLGTPVYAPRAGVVDFAGVERGYGAVVRLRHTEGFETVFAHLQDVRVVGGERVARGAVIGTVGDSGRTDAPLLYFEVRRDGRPVDPQAFMAQRRK